MRLIAPWTDRQVERLNIYQKLGYMHEFTCMREHRGNRTLIATNAGWICPSCDYTQDWAHESMLRPPPDPIQTLRRLAGDSE